MKDYKVKQCILSKGNQSKVVWIPSKYAVNEKVLRIQQDDGWVVKAVGDIELDKSYVDMMSESYKNTRKTSDI